jgi:transposase
MARPRKYPPELLDRGARVVIESGRPIAHVARDLGVPAETLRRYVRQVEADEGLRQDLPTTEEREEIKALRKEVYELRRANEILKAASVMWDPEIPGDYIDVDVKDGWVTLKGEVDHQYQSDQAFDHAASLYGVTGVTNKIKVIEAQ